MLYHVLDRAKESKLTTQVVVASPQRLPEMLPDILEFVYNGIENDVLSRYFHAAKEFKADYIVRLTSDCPFLDPFLIDYVIYHSIGSDYGSNVMLLTFPDGNDVEVMSMDALEHLNGTVRSPFDREHVTTFIRNNAFAQIDMNIISIQSMKDFSYLKTSVDTEEDLEHANRMVELGKVAVKV